MSAKGLRVLLVNCNTPMDNLIPAGVSLLSAVLKAEGCQVRCFDTTFYRPADFVTGDEARAMTLQVKRTNFSELGIPPKAGTAEDDFRALVAGPSSSCPTRPSARGASPISSGRSGPRWRSVRSTSSPT